MNLHSKNLLLVEDDDPIRDLLSTILTGCGYRVRGAKDGFSALALIREQVPDIILSDLNMPGMSGFEFLSVIRRRLPSILVVAMSGVFSGMGIPESVSADAFYEKGTSISALLQILDTVTHPGGSPLLRHSTGLTPIWVQRNGHDPTGAEYVTITCPECLRSFPQPLLAGTGPQNETPCPHCANVIHYAIVPKAAWAAPVFPRAELAIPSASRQPEGAHR